MLAIGKYVDQGRPMSSYPLNVGKKLWLHPSLNNTGGNKIYDISGNNNHGTLTNGPLWTPTPYGMGLTFTAASSQYVDCGAGVPESTTLLSFSCRAKPVSVGAEYNFAGRRSGGNVGWRLGLNSTSGRFLFTIFNVANVESGASGAVAGEWADYGVTYDGTTVRFYLNGQNFSSVSQAGSVASSGIALHVGAFNNTGSAAGFFDGPISDVNLWAGRVLSPAEMFAHYDQSRRGNPDTLRWVRPWSFGATIPSTVEYIQQYQKKALVAKLSGMTVHI